MTHLVVNKVEVERSGTPSCDRKNCGSKAWVIELEMSSTGSSDDLKENEERNKEPKYFPNHISPKEVQQGLKSGQLVRGVINVNPKFTKMCFVESECSQFNYVISSLIDRNRAMDKDEVILKKKSVLNERKTEVEVVHIAKKVHPRSAVGFLKPLDGNKNFALFSPRDKKVPKMHIHKSHWPGDFETDPTRFKDILFFVKMSKWSKVRQALGEIVEVLGVSGNFQVERVVVLRQFCINPDFDKAVLPKCVQSSQMEWYRDDLRRRCVFTIDKSETTDIDDALSCEELSNGNYEISVHISDVSHYLREHTQVDEAVRERATSVYLMDQVCHMLPDELRSECSLFPGCNKRTFSIFWEITPNGQIVTRRGVKTVINSCARLTYTQASKLIDDALDEPVQILNGFTLADLRKSLKNLHKIASVLRTHRKFYYGVSTGHVKASFSFNASGEPLDVVNEHKVPTQELVEEFMLMANATVAQRIYSEFPSLALLRTHAGPIPAKMSKLRKNLAGVGIHIDASSAKEIQKSLDKYVGDDDLGRVREIVLKWLLHKCMKKQKYLCGGSCKEQSDLRHFGLGFPLYTHFTSPIRRYADIMTHRLLAASLKYTPKPEWSPAHVANIASNCNNKEIQAKSAQKASFDLFLNYYIEKRRPYVQTGVVCHVKEQSFDVIVLKTRSIVRIYTNAFDDDWIWTSERIDGNENFRSWRMQIKFPETVTEPEESIVVDLFSLVRVELTKCARSNQLKAKLCRPRN